MKEYVKWAKEAALSASKEILKIYKEGSFCVELKEDDSPVTVADHLANEVIVDYLKEKSSFPILSEELSAHQTFTAEETIWVVDPLDGTKEFIKKNHQFSVNIALIHKKRPLVAVTYIPMREELYYAIKGEGAFFVFQGKTRQIRVSDKREHLKMLRSRNPLSKRVLAICEKEQISEIVKVGSAYKGCLLAKGEGEIYISDGRTMEWDVASIDLLVEEAGGICRDLEGNVLLYNRENHENTKGFFMVNRKENILWI